jgi:two-component system, response regulator RegA
MGQHQARFTTVLIVDDDERVLATYDRYRSRNRTIVTASNGQAACEIARKHAPGLALVDLQLGKESGIDVIRKLKAVHPSTIIVLLSGYASVQATVQAMRAGADDVLEKPVSLTEILRRLERPPEEIDVIETPTLERVQWEHVHRVLADCDGNISLAARRLGVYRSTMQRWLRKRAPKD